MGALTKPVFQALLGWIRTLCSEVWITVSSPDGMTFLQWIGKHWKELTLVLCLLGMVLDFIVYLIRWQPYRVWFRFLRGEKSHESDNVYKTDQVEAESSEKSVRTAKYRDYDVMNMSSDESESQKQYSSDQFVENNQYTENEAFASAFPYSDVDPEREVIQEVLWTDSPGTKPILSKPQMNEEGDPYYNSSSADPASLIPEGRLAWKRNEPEGTTETFDRALRPRRRRTVSRILSDEQHDAVAPEQLIDRYAAYRRPVYPRNWKAAKNQNEEKE